MAYLQTCSLSKCMTSRSPFFFKSGNIDSAKLIRRAQLYLNNFIFLCVHAMQLGYINESGNVRFWLLRPSKKNLNHCALWQTLMQFKGKKTKQTAKVLLVSLHSNCNPPMPMPKSRPSPIFHCFSVGVPGAKQSNTSLIS